MSEQWYDSFEREACITRAEIMHELNNPLNRSQYPVIMAEERSGYEMFQDALGDDLSKWTGDILDAFRVDKTRWSERIIDPRTNQRLDPALAAGIQGNLAETLRDATLQRLNDGIVDGYCMSEAKLTLELERRVQVDLYCGGEMWRDPNLTSTELAFRVVFRLVS